MNTQQPDTASMETKNAYILRHRGQHVFGDRRNEIRDKFTQLVKSDHSKSETQGLVRKIDPIQFESIKNIVKNTADFSPTIILAITSDNLNGFHSFPGNPIGPCPRCLNPAGATAAHFLQCEAMKQTRQPFMDEILKTFEKNAAKQLKIQPMSGDEILKSIFQVDPMPSWKEHSESPEGEREPERQKCIPPTSKPKHTKPKGKCPICNEQQTWRIEGVVFQKHKCERRSKRRCPDCNIDQLVQRNTDKLEKHKCSQKWKIYRESKHMTEAEPDFEAEEQNVMEIPKSFWQYQRRQNARTIAAFIGMFSVCAMAFFEKFIQNQKMRQKTMRNIQTTLVECACQSWWAQKIYAAQTLKPTQHLRKRKAIKLPDGPLASSAQAPAHRTKKRHKNIPQVTAKRPWEPLVLQWTKRNKKHFV